MSFTVQSVLDLARGDLNDADKIRFPDSDLLKAFNDCIARTYVYRPDLRFGNYPTAYTDLTVSSDCPLGIEYRQAIASYIIWSLQSGDDAFVLDERASKSYKEYLAGIGMS